jgi:mycofactocin precursor
MLETTTRAVDIEQQDAAEPRETTQPPPTPHDGSDQTLVEAELLVEDVSIDGMCGVY